MIALITVFLGDNFPKDLLLNLDLATEQFLKKITKYKYGKILSIQKDCSEN